MYTTFSSALAEPQSCVNRLESCHWKFVHSASQTARLEKFTILLLPSGGALRIHFAPSPSKNCLLRNCWQIFTNPWKIINWTSLLLFLENNGRALDSYSRSVSLPSVSGPVLQSVDFSKYNNTWWAAVANRLECSSRNAESGFDPLLLRWLLCRQVQSQLLSTIALCLVIR